jgi:hypothetical protein
MALRNADDPVLDDQMMSNVAWYHTSTDLGWPGSSHQMPPAAAALLARMMPGDVVVSVRERHETQALHLGTYEAAIESMLRRMGDQDDGGAQWYLYRVALRRGAMTIEPGWRDENTAEAAQITQADLGDSGAIRYLNVHESPGSVSVAARPESIAAVQCIALPVQALKVAAAPSLVCEVAQVRARLGQLEADRAVEPDPLDRIRRRASERHGVPYARSPTDEQHKLLDHISMLIEDEYLPGVSLPVRAKFAAALSAWRQAQQGPVDDISYIEQFAVMATALTRPAGIVRALGRELVRTIWRLRPGNSAPRTAEPGPGAGTPWAVNSRPGTVEVRLRARRGPERGED